jgi:hypothetical protein
MTILLVHPIRPAFFLMCPSPDIRRAGIRVSKERLFDMEGFIFRCQVIEEDVVVPFACALQPFVEKVLRGGRTRTGIQSRYRSSYVFGPAI